MRAGLVVVMVAVALAFGSSSSADVFPDLPGADMLEESITAREIGGTTSGQRPAPDTSDDRVPAPDTSDDAEEVTKAAATADQVKVISEMPGGGGLPIIKDVASSGSDFASTAPLVALAALVVFAMTRFLYRLNDLGRRA